MAENKKNMILPDTEPEFTKVSYGLPVIGSVENAFEFFLLLPVAEEEREDWGSADPASIKPIEIFTVYPNNVVTQLYPSEEKAESEDSRRIRHRAVTRLKKRIKDALGGMPESTAALNCLSRELRLSIALAWIYCKEHAEPIDQCADCWTFRTLLEDLSRTVTIDVFDDKPREKRECEKKKNLLM